MCARSKSSDRDVTRPFDNAVIQQARALAERYQIVLAFEDGEWYGHAMEMPDVMADGKTPDECVAHTREALAAAVATMLEQGLVPPVAAQQGQRTEQVNIRLTVEEKAFLESTAKASGYRGISDFVRSSALEATRGAGVSRRTGSRRFAAGSAREVARLRKGAARRRGFRR
jgi:predicted RNase H-like HicB family nuclease